MTDIQGYEKLYSITQEGRVYTHRLKRLMSQKVGSQYPCVALWKDRKKTAYTIHSLVAKHFIPNPDNRPCINHKDGNKRNNNVNNLEWVTYGENLSHAYQTGLFTARLKGVFGKDHPNAKKINQLTLDGKLIKTYDCIKDAANEMGWSLGRISKVLRNYKGRTQTGGFRWKYAK